MMTLSENLLAFRKQKGYTQEQVAIKLNISPQAISKWETGQSMPDMSLLLDVAELYDCSLDELFGRVDSRKVKLDEKVDPSELFFKVNVDCKDGDKVNINFPFELVKLFAQNGQGDITIGGSSALSQIDWKQLIDMAEKGLLGKLLEVKSADGDIVNIFVGK